MTEIKDPGTPATDELARNAALNAIVDQLVSMPPIDAEDYATYERTRAGVLGLLSTHTVTWERDVNANGVAVRCYVLRGPWEVDPEPQPVRIQKGDIVRYDDHEFGAHDDWIVTSVPLRGRKAGESLLFLKRPEWIHGSYVNTGEHMVTLIRRPDGVTSEPATIGRGDVVRYRDRRDDGREWTVGEETYGRDPRTGESPLIVSMISPGRDDVAEHQYASTSSLEVVRRAGQ